MSDHHGLRYLFDQLKLNVGQARWLAIISEFNFEIKYIKGKENRVIDALSRQVQVNHIAATSSYGTNLQDHILQASQQDDRYMELMHRLQRCLDFQQVKVECKHLGGLLHPIAILEWKWEAISMDFITGFLRTYRQHDSIMAVVGRLTKVAHFILVKYTYSTSDVAQVFMRDVVRLHDVPKKIVSDMDAKFTSKFWKELFAGLGTKLDFSTTYHPQTDGQTKRVNKILENMLRMYVMHQQWK
eukprot:PITA_05955